MDFPYTGSMTTTKPPPESVSSASATTRNPLYVKIGKRIRQARLMAKETNGRALSERMGWSGGRLNNFETGISTPGIEETLQLCEALKADPCWITYGVGSPRPISQQSQQSIRHRNLMAVFGEAKSRGTLPELLAATSVTPERLEKLRAQPFKQIPGRLARQCEKHLGQRRGRLDEIRGGNNGNSCENGDGPLAEDERDLLAVFGRLSPADRAKLRAMADILRGDSVGDG